MKTGTEETTTAEQEQPAQFSNLLSGLIDEKTATELLEIEKKIPVKEVPAPKGKNEPEGEEAEEEEEESEEEESEEAEEEEGSVKGKKDGKKTDKDKEEPELPENKLGLKFGKKADEKKGSKVDIKSFDEIPLVLKSKYGQDVKDVKSLPKFFETVDKWRSDSQLVDKVTKEKENAVAVLQGLPEDLLEAVKTHYQGQDYRKAFENNSKLDFSKPVEKQKAKNLVNNYFAGEFTDEDFEEEELSKELKIAIKASEKQYISEKNTREQRAKDHVEKAAQKEIAYKASIQSSVTALKTAFPDMAQDVLADVEHSLSSGTAMREFFNPDGTYKPQAAEMLMLAKHGKEVISQLMEIAEKRGESTANEEIVRRAPKTVKDKKDGKETPIRKEVTEHIEQILPPALVRKNVF